MEISPIRMALLLFYSFVFGMGVGAFYDANRIIRVFLGERYSRLGIGGLADWRLPICHKPIYLDGKKKTVRTAVIFLGDFLCVLVAALGIIILNYSYNSGEFRIFTFFGAFAGFLIYYHTLGRLVMLVSEPLAILIKYLLFSFFIIFGYPFLKFGQIIVKNIKKVVFLYRFALEKRHKKLYNVKEEVCLLEMAKKGFLSIGDNIQQG